MSDDTVELENWGRWFFDRFEASPKVVYERVIRGCLSIKEPTMGQAWKPLGELFETLGPFEFEVYLNCVLDAKADLIKERGFYPKILLGEESVEIYESRREALIEKWAHPARRYRDPVFHALFASETNIAQEAVAQISRTGEFDWDCCVANCLSALHPYWILSTWTWKDASKLRELMGPDLYKGTQKAQKEKVQKSLSERFQRERIRASFECSVTTARRVLQKKRIPSEFVIPVRGTVSYDWSPIKATFEILKEHVPQTRKPLSILE